MGLISYLRNVYLALAMLALSSGPVFALDSQVLYPDPGNIAGSAGTNLLENLETPDYNYASVSAGTSLANIFLRYSTGLAPATELTALKFVTRAYRDSGTTTANRITSITYQHPDAFGNCPTTGYINMGTSQIPTSGQFTTTPTYYTGNSLSQNFPIYLSADGQGRICIAVGVSTISSPQMYLDTIGMIVSYGGTGTGSGTGQEYQLESCDTFDVFCILRNWFGSLTEWLFAFDTETIDDSFQDLKDTTDTKVPFAYTNAIVNIEWDSATYSATPHWQVPLPQTTSPFISLTTVTDTTGKMSPLLGIVRAIMTGVLLLLFIVYLIKYGHRWFPH